MPARWWITHTSICSEVTNLAHSDDSSPRISEAILTKVNALPSGLRSHTFRVEAIAVSLARQHHLDEHVVRMGALAHDLARASKAHDLLARAKGYGLEINPIEHELPILLHGPVAAEMLRIEYGLDDPEIYDAIFWHTTAREDLNPTAKAVFLADKLDPQKSARYLYQDRLKALAQGNLDEAIWEFLNRELMNGLRHGNLIHPSAIHARNRLMITGLFNIGDWE